MNQFEDSYELSSPRFYLNLSFVCQSPVGVRLDLSLLPLILAGKILPQVLDSALL